jgi:hypothetical protein
MVYGIVLPTFTLDFFIVGYSSRLFAAISLRTWFGGVELVGVTARIDS